MLTIFCGYNGLFTSPHAVPNLYDFLSSAGHERKYFWNIHIKTKQNKNAKTSLETAWEWEKDDRTVISEWAFLLNEKTIFQREPLYLCLSTDETVSWQFLPQTMSLKYQRK